MKLMLCETGDVYFKDKCFQLKYDGTRAILKNEGSLSLINRRGNNITKSFPEFKDFKIPSNTILDGEVVVLTDQYKCSFNKLAMREHTTDSFKIDLLSKTMPSTFVAFDILKLKGKDLTNYALKDRLDLLNTHFTDEKCFRVIKNFKEEEVKDLVEKFNLEGYIVKNSLSKYYNKRSAEWVKRKRYLEDVFEIAGYKSEKREISALLLKNGMKDCGYVNFTKNEKEWLKKFKDHITNEKGNVKLLDNTFKAQISYMPLENSDKLRFPILKGIF
jgi:ATP-dependent DNA ligase